MVGIIRQMVTVVGKCWLLGKGFLVSLFTVRGRPLETSDTKQRSGDVIGPHLPDLKVPPCLASDQFMVVNCCETNYLKNYRNHLFLGGLFHHKVCGSLVTPIHPCQQIFSTKCHPWLESSLPR
ncbi:unnamed protein product [Macrosiphum euphorbiae]|uniref:Secreted protein n=1 Tax=Macrosiphum euphorbiae TaxID=13131 RepID=A0AAV0XQ13_9HEMI|nr:unnamed protein product [Macrosiphum euphorbiae]